MWNFDCSRELSLYPYPSKKPVSAINIKNIHFNRSKAAKEMVGIPDCIYSIHAITKAALAPSETTEAVTK